LESVGADDLPGVALLQPLVGDFHLPAVADLLVEDAELVADAVADGRDFERGERIQIAGRQPTEAAVAQARLLFEREQRVEVLAERAHCFARVPLDTEVDQVVAQLRPDQELGRQVAGHLDIVRGIGLHCPHPAREHPVAHAVGERHVPVVGGSDAGETRLQTRKVVEHRAPQCLGREAGTGRFGSHAGLPCAACQRS